MYIYTKEYLLKNKWVDAGTYLYKEVSEGVRKVLFYSTKFDGYCSTEEL